MQEAELWVGDIVRCNHSNDRQGKRRFDFEFWMDVLVAHGSWVRELNDGDYEYLQVGPEPGDLDLIH
jgi:hypothetical protein